MSYEIKGKLIEKNDTVQVNDKFKKRELIINAPEEYGGSMHDNFIKLQLIQDACNILDPVNINDEIKVFFNIKGNRWEKEGKVSYFTNLQAWKIETVNAGTSPDLESTPEDSDDLPF